LIGTQNEVAAVTALLPGQIRPKLHRGQRMKLELQSYPTYRGDVVIDEVGDQIIGPGEAKRLLGPDAAESFGIDGPLVVVRGRLVSPAVGVKAPRPRYYDGMVGKVEVQIGSQSVLARLIPSLRGVLESSDE